MGIWAILPIKKLSEGKSRLRGVLPSDALEALNRRLFSNTLNTLLAVKTLERVLVISRDEEVLTRATHQGAIALCEEEPGGLNRAIRQALGFIESHGGGSPLIIPADLPALSTSELHTLLIQGSHENFTLIVPDKFQTGTNILYTARCDLIRPQFGSNSFQKHCGQTMRKRAKLLVYLRKALQADLDTPEDFDKMTQSELLDESFNAIKERTAA